MRKFFVCINYNGYHAKTVVEALDNVESIEQSILDKLGRNEIKFEKDGFTHGKWITYEEFRDDRTPIQYETVLGTRVAKGASEVRES
tara:strand:- start:998 stop:1258 length:261 start_codon:yes stop_codon:yes gene_type:complete